VAEQVEHAGINGADVRRPGRHRVVRVVLADDSRQVTGDTRPPLFV
jgi:hypothetical protein